MVLKRTSDIWPFLAAALAVPVAWMLRDASANLDELFLIPWAIAGLSLTLVADWIRGGPLAARLRRVLEAPIKHRAQQQDDARSATVIDPRKPGPLR